MRTSLTLSRLGVLGVLGALAGLTACTIVLDTDRHRSDVVPIAATDFCAELADIACTGRRDCCPQPDLDFDMCLRGVATDCAADYGAYALDQRTGYDPGQAGLALAEARELVAACDPGVETWTLSPLGFQRSLAGSIPLGEPCDPNPFDVPNLFACLDDGVCTQMGTAANPNWVCAPPTALGGECTYDGMCEPGLRCSTAVQLIVAGTCQPLKPTGEACGRASECETFVCDTTCRDATNEEAYCGGGR